MHHLIEPYPAPKDKAPLYVNEPTLIDNSLNALFIEEQTKAEKEPDNIRIYIPMDLSEKAILRRLDYIIAHYEEANEANEMNFLIDVDQLLFQLEIYDQILSERNKSKSKHSEEAISIVKEIIVKLEEIPDGCAECFPFETIDELRAEYLEKAES